MKRMVSLLLLLAVVIVPLSITAQDVNPLRADDPFWNADDAQLEAWRVIDGVEEGAEITWWTMSLSPTFDEYILEIVENFEATYPEVNVTWEDVPWDQLQDRTRNAFNAGNAPDVINLSPSWLSEFIEAGLLTDMDAAMAAYPDVRAQYVDGAWTTAAVDGVSYQIPWYLGLSNFTAYNTEILAELGLTEADLPSTWSDVVTFTEQVRTLSEGDYYGMSINFGGGTERNLLPYLLYDDVSVYDAEGNLNLNSPEAVASLELWASLIANDLVPRESVTEDHRQMIERFSQGEVAAIMVAPHMLRLVGENNPDVFEVMGVAPGVTGISGKNGVDVQSLVVPANSAYPNAALALATFITNAETQAAFGKEVGIYPSNLMSYEDPFFQTVDEANVATSVRPLAYDYVVTAENRTFVFTNDAEVQQAIVNAQTAALLGEKSAQQALDDLVAEISTLTAE